LAGWEEVFVSAMLFMAPMFNKNGVHEKRQAKIDPVNLIAFPPSLAVRAFFNGRFLAGP